MLQMNLKREGKVLFGHILFHFILFYFFSFHEIHIFTRADTIVNMLGEDKRVEKKNREEKGETPLFVFI